MSKSISVVINARMQSTRVPNKLMRPFAGTSLIDIALAKLAQMDFFEHRFLAAAEPELIAKAQPYPQIEILERKTESVRKGINPMEVTFAHLWNVPSDYIFIFNPCLPTITVETIRKAYEAFQAQDFNSYTAVIPTGDWIFDSEGRALTNSDPRNVTTNRNQSFYKACHAFHIINKAFFRDNLIMWTFGPNDPHPLAIPEEESVDVDTMLEFEFAEFYYRAKQDPKDESAHEIV